MNETIRGEADEVSNTPTRFRSEWTVAAPPPQVVPALLVGVRQQLLGYRHFP